MPYKFETDKIKLPRELNRTIKLTDEDRERIKKLYLDGTSIHGIARAFKGKCCKRTVQFVLFPERMQAAKANRDGKKYYDREENTEAVKKTRQYKQKMKKAGKI